MRLSVLLAFFVTSALGHTIGEELDIDITNPVQCNRKTQVGDTISVNYRGTLLDGEEFDSSYNRDPIQFRVGKGEVIKGWDQGLLDMCIGEKRKLTIPADLAYGAGRGVGTCKANCILLFDTELISIKGVDKEATIEEPEPEKEEEKVSQRQSGLDHVILGIAGLLFVVSGTVLLLRARRGGRAGVGSLGEKYEIVGPRVA